jgi:hypothetical protein
MKIKKAKTGNKLKVSEISEQGCTGKEWVQLSLLGPNKQEHEIELRLIEDQNKNGHGMVTCEDKRSHPFAGIRIRNLPKDVFVTVCRADDEMRYNEPTPVKVAQEGDFYILLWQDKNARDHQCSHYKYWPRIKASVGPKGVLKEIYYEEKLENLPKLEKGEEDGQKERKKE